VGKSASAGRVAVVRNARHSYTLGDIQIAVAAEYLAELVA